MDTIIFDESNYETQTKEQGEKLIQNHKEAFVQANQEQIERHKKIKRAAAIAGGLGVVGAAIAFAPISAPDIITGEEDAVEGILVPDKPAFAASVTDDMSFREAFATARTEVGQGGYFEWHGQKYNTYYKEEWDELSEDDRREFVNNVFQENNQYAGVQSSSAPVVIYDSIEVAHGITDDLSFNDAFALARVEVGPGGVFVYKGNIYSTFTQEELDSMTQEQIDSFNTAMSNVGINVQHISDTSFSQNVRYDNVEATRASYIDETDTSGEVIGEEIEDGNRLTLMEDDGELILMVDFDNTGEHDIAYFPDRHEIVDLHTGQTYDSDALFASANEAYPIGTQEVILDSGNVAVVTSFSDGHFEAMIDSDGNGAFDTLVVYNNQTGYMTAYDVNGQIIARSYVGIREPIDFPDSYDVPIDGGHDLDDDPDFDNDMDIDSDLFIN